MDDPGPLIGSGRAADVYDLGGGRVLRRYRIDRGPGATEREGKAPAMCHLRAHGYPVPEVFDADGPDLVMQLLHGGTLLDDLERRPWHVDRAAATWADLQRRLADVPVGDLAVAGLDTRFGEPEAVLHLDFHPDNIVLTADGPVVIDWTNVSLGPAMADAAAAWLIAATSSVVGGWWQRQAVRLLRNRLVGRFVDARGRAAAAALMPVVAEQRLLDRNVRPEEAGRIRELVASLS